jgi:hypothetical protein
MKSLALFLNRPTIPVRAFAIVSTVRLSSDLLQVRDEHGTGEH